MRCISAEADEIGVGGAGVMLQDICDTDQCDI